MIDVKKAADISANYLKKFFPDVESVQLEEIELTDDKKFWNITLSFDSADNATGYIVLGKVKKYKIFRIDAETGQVYAMKIRELK